MLEIVLDELKQKPITDQRTEICERKGLGHPDTICDSIMDEVSRALSREYIKRFGAVLHHNIDKGLLVAGDVKVAFGGGKVLKPMLLVFGDRATFNVNSEDIPVEEITVETAKEWIRSNLRHVDPDEHVRYQVELKPGSQALTDIFARRGKFLGANDTSAAVGFAPLTPTEEIVRDTEYYLNSREFKKSFPQTGEDVKVMGLRKDRNLNLTVGIAFIDKYIESEESYFRVKREVHEEIMRYVESRVDFKVNVDLNTADVPGRGLGGVYLTVLGTSADGGDCGQVGRGNRVNGIIPLNRPTCSEAACGKNPVNHVGKIYNILTYKIAEEVYRKVPGLKEVYVWLLSQIGKPINEPKVVSAQLILEPNISMKDVEAPVRDTIQAELDDLETFCKNLTYGTLRLC
ncbi:methionine adenosyltransferase [Candidatus Bathyarchaeota archaeon]|nr:methionine adenosyltransferase [Candidatus Bathyarchaeota archaeon]MBS7628972.1 methionine adenosyltransferase [Candidatus Bathyarchaeota archaeon]